MNESNEPSAETNESTNQEATGGSTADAFRAALMADESGESHKGEAGESQTNAEPEAGKPKGKPKVLKDLAERLSLEDKDLYAIEIPSSREGEKPYTLGALKDLAAHQDDFQVRETQFAERVSKQEAEWTRSQTEFAELLAHIDPKAIKPELQARVKAKVDADNKREMALIAKSIPEWSNQQVREADLGAMVNYLKDFGIGEIFLTSTMSHKVFRLVRHAALQKQRIEKALANVEKVRKPSTTGKGAAGNGNARKPAASKPQARSDMRSQFASTLRSAG